MKKTTFGLLTVLALVFFVPFANAQIKLREAPMVWSAVIPDCNFEAMIKSLDLQVENISSDRSVVDFYDIVGPSVNRVVSQRYSIEINNCRVRSMSKEVFFSPESRPFYEIVLYSLDSTPVRGNIFNVALKIVIVTFHISDFVLNDIFLSGKISLRGTFAIFSYDNNRMFPSEPG